MDLKEINKNILFDSHIHQYSDKNGIPYLSVTQFLSRFKTPFDPQGDIARACAKRDGLSIEKIKQKWRDEGDRAIDYGNKIHSEIEHYIKTKQILPTDDKDIVEDFSKIEFKGVIESEIGIHSSVYRMAGTCDIIEIFPDNLLKVHDLKTNKEFIIKSKYGDRFSYPINKLNENHYTMYSLQILIYGEILKEWGFRFEPGWILHINPKTRKIDKYEVLDLRKEVIRLLDYHKAMNSW